MFFAFLGLLLVGAILFTGFPAKMVTAVLQRKPLPVYSVGTDEKKAALGINCAWGDGDIDAILGLLEREKVKASFFVTGTFCRKFPDAVRRIHGAGHEIGSHSNNHVDLPSLDEAGILEEIRLGNQEIAALTGSPPVLFRTPSGSYNDLVIRAIEGEGMVPVQWSADSLDYQNPTPAEMQRRILESLEPGAILLFHAGAKNTPEALPGIIAAMKAEGYGLLPVGELIYPPPYRTDHTGRQFPA
jgi:peptidoglycan/xylan/chitin deacetylase (PgdA/CDA1 family)